MTDVKKNNSRAIFDVIMRDIKPEEKLLHAGAASRLADSFAEEGFEIVPSAEWKENSGFIQCSHCNAYIHHDAVTLNPIRTKRCHECGARMTNWQV